MRRFLGIGVFVLITIVTLLVTPQGPSLNVDSPVYLSIADDIRHGDFGIVGSSRGAGWSVLGFPLVIAFAKAVSPAKWLWIVWAVNVVCSALTGLLLVTVVRQVTRSVPAAVAALLFYLGCFDIHIWTRFVLTDSFYALWACLTFLLLADGLSTKRVPRRGLWLALSVLACLVTRPVGVAILPAVLITEGLIRPAIEGGRSRARRTVWLLLAFGIVAGSLYRAYIYQDLRRWPTSYMREKLTEYAGREKTGEVVYDRPETRRPRPVTIADHLVIQTDRFVRFFQITTPAFSRAHNLVSLAYYVPLYLLGLIGTIAAFRSQDRRRRAVVLATLVWIGATALLSALTLLDFDWRYRLPIMPQLILLACCGVDALRLRFIPGRAGTSARDGNSPADSPERAYPIPGAAGRGAAAS
jgi:hypothetical protein